MTILTIRAVTRAEIPAIKPIVAVTLFPAQMLDAMIAPCFGSGDNTDIWFAATEAAGKRRRFRVDRVA